MYNLHKVKSYTAYPLTMEIKESVKYEDPGVVQGK